MMFIFKVIIVENIIFLLSYFLAMIHDEYCYEIFICIYAIILNTLLLILIISIV